MVEFNLDDVGLQSEGEQTHSLQTSQPPPSPKKRRGFAVMDPKRVSEIASKGGKAAHAAGTAHEFSKDEAREAGRKGGYATHAKRKATPSKDEG